MLIGVSILHLSTRPIADCHGTDELEGSFNTLHSKGSFHVGHLAEALSHEDGSKANLSHYSLQAHQLQGVQFVLLPFLLPSHWVLGFFPGHPEKDGVVLLDSLDGNKSMEIAKEPDYSNLIRALQRAAQLVHLDHPGSCSACHAKHQSTIRIGALTQKVGHQVRGLRLQRDSWSCGFWAMGMICVLAFTRCSSAFLHRISSETLARHGATLLPDLFRRLMSGWQRDSADDKAMAKCHMLDEQVLQLLCKLIAFPPWRA